MVDCYIEKGRNSQRNDIQREEYFHNPPGFANNVICITHRADINYFCSIQFFISFQETSRQEDYDYRLGNVVEVNTAKRH